MKIWINGCFDVLHYGHLKMISYAGGIADELVIGIDSDRRVKELKGFNRPYHSEVERKFNLSQLKYVSKVIVFDSDVELESHIRNENVDGMVIGSDYKGKNIIGIDFIPRIYYFDRIEGKSTTDILNY